MYGTVIRKRGIYRGNFPRKAEFIEKVNDCLERARLYIEGAAFLPHITIVFVPKGHTVGRARRKETEKGSGKHIYNLEFSVEAIEKDFDDMVTNTIPHEVAHIVEAFIHNKFSHSARWRGYDMRLGGNGQRCHSMDVTPARKRRKQDRFEYEASCGTLIWVTRTIHNKIQGGQTRIVRGTGGKIKAHMETGNVHHY